MSDGLLCLVQGLQAFGASFDSLAGLGIGCLLKIGVLSFDGGGVVFAAEFNPNNGFH